MLYRRLRNVSIPAPRLVFRPVLFLFLLLRSAYYFVARVFVCEPLFKSYCSRIGKNVHTGVFIHWVEGAGRIELGDDVLVDGKCSFSFAAQYAPDPTLAIGSHTGIGHNCSFVIGRRITIGERCRIASDVVMFDSSGHPSDPMARLAGAPAPLDSVKPITLERNVWVGRGAIIFPGVTIGENSVVAAGAVVLASVPANSLVIGNPARRMAAV